MPGGLFGGDVEVRGVLSGVANTVDVGVTGSAGTALIVDMI